MSDLKEASIEEKKQSTKTTKGRNSYLKCRKCGNKYHRDLMDKIGGFNYCPTCSAQVRKASLSDKELKELLYEIVDRDQQKMTLLSVGIYKAIQREEFTLAGAVYTLKYIKLIDQWDSVTPTNAYFMILKYYGDAQKHWITLKHIKDSYPEAFIQNLRDKPVVEVTINRSDINRDDRKFIEAQRVLLYGPEIDLNDIIEDDDTDEY